MKQIKTLFSTRRSMAAAGTCELLHDMSDEELKELQNCFLETVSYTHLTLPTKLEV